MKRTLHFTFRVVVVADGLDGVSDDPLKVHMPIAGYLPKDHHLPNGQGCLTGHLAEWICLKESIQDGIRNLIRHFVYPSIVIIHTI